MIGLFVTKNSSDSSNSIEFYPSPDFLEAGKFRMRRQIRKDMEESGKASYEEFYEYLRTTESLTQLSFSSIATVCGEGSTADSVK